MSKQYRDFNFTQRLFCSILHWCEKKLYQREWTYSDQVYNAMIRNQESTQWLSEYKQLTILGERNMVMLKDDWYSTGLEDISKFRGKIERSFDDTTN